MPRWPAAVVAAALVLTSPGRADDRTLGVLAVADPPGPSTELAELTFQLRGALAERTGGVLESSEIRARMGGQVSSASLLELDRAYAGAVATFHAGDHEVSIRTLRAVMGDLEHLPDSPEAFAQWTRAGVRLARAEQTVGHRAEATALLERLLRAAPALMPDPQQYPPSFLAQVEEVRSRLAAQPRRRLTVHAERRGARVFVEGREIGMAPTTLSLPPGRYRVSGRADGVAAPAVWADLSATDQLVALDFALADALRPASGPGLALRQADRTGKVIVVAAWLGLDQAVTTSLLMERDIVYLQATLLDVRKGQLLREARLRLANRVAPAGGLTALAAFLVSGQQSTLLAIEGAPLPAPGEPVARTAPAAAPAAPAAAPAAPPAPAAAATSGVTLGLGLGYGMAFGDAALDMPMGDLTSGSVPVVLEAGYRFAGRFALGAYLQYAYARSAEGPCQEFRAQLAAAGIPGVSCSTSAGYVLRYGIEGSYRFASPGRTIVPWLGLGVGLERSKVGYAASVQGQQLDIVQKAGGFEYLNLQLGVEWAASPGLWLGPFVLLSLAQYSDATVSLAGPLAEQLGMAGSTTEDIPSSDRKLHQWLILGLRGRLDL